MPRTLSLEDQTAFTRRLAEYLEEAGLSRCAVIFHGGEPLLAGVAKLVAFASAIRAATTAQVDIGLQTNGLLLTEAALDAFEAADIAVSLSIDGPQEANDKHRTSRKRRSSFDRAFAALERLKRHPKIFAGVIAVVDPSTRPEDLLAFFAEHQPPKVDFLLPDAHHLRPPPGRDQAPEIYIDWQRRAFDIWLDQYPHLPVRTFEALLDAVAGLPSNTDAFGLGDVSLISIETDGSYHDLDVLKVTADGATKIGGTVRDISISAIATSAHIDAHRRLLSKPGLCETCRTCSIVDICGGGSLPHRYGADGFDNPTVYCREMKALVGHVRARLEALLTTQPVAENRLPSGFDIARFEFAEQSDESMRYLCRDAKEGFTGEFLTAVATLEDDGAEGRNLATAIRSLEPAHLAELAFQPGAVAWQRARLETAKGRSIHAIDGQSITAGVHYLADLLERSLGDLHRIAVGRNDHWLRTPFGNAIYFEDEELAAQGRLLADEALRIIAAWRPALATELRETCRAIQFVRDPLAHPEKIVSFSDNSVPGALYVSIFQGDRLIDPYDLADSLIHEHRHQKLYLFERLAPTIYPTEKAVVSPWREDLRPPSGLLHAVFVFIELRRFWIHIRDNGPSRLHNRAVNQIQDTDEHLADAFVTLETCPLTPAGRELTVILRRASMSVSEPA